MYKDNGIWCWKHKASSICETGYEGMIDTLNIISVEAYKTLDSEAQRNYAKEVLRRIREVNIYPIHYYNDEGVKREIIDCINTVVLPVFDRVVENGTQGKTLLDFMFPNLHLAEAGNMQHNCMYSRFYDDEKMLKCLTRHMKNYRFTSMRTPFFMYGRFFWNTPVNFSPMRAKAICLTFCKPGGTVYDFSAGYGGRMLGILSSWNNYKYIGCEPCTNTFYNLKVLGKHIESVTQRSSSYELHNDCSEDLQLEENSVDFAFSCPPYYGLERYSVEETQSINRYPVYTDWLNGYVVPTLENVYKALKPGCRLGFVIAGKIYYRNKPYSLAEDWCRLAQKVGFKFEKKYPIKTRARKAKEDAEALYIFVKEE